MKKIKQAIHRWILRRVAKKYGYEIVNAWIFFTFNYSFPGGNPKVWMENEYGKCMGDHFYRKFDYLYEKYGSHAVMGMFWCELGIPYRKQLFEFFRTYYANPQYFK